MRIICLSLLIAGLMSSCGPRTGTTGEPDQTQGNPQAQPEKRAQDIDKKQDGGDKADRDAHTGLPQHGSPKRQ
jgi:hypothetical protein